MPASDCSRVPSGGTPCGRLLALTEILTNVADLIGDLEQALGEARELGVDLELDAPGQEGEALRRLLHGGEEACRLGPGMGRQHARKCRQRGRVRNARRQQGEMRAGREEAQLLHGVPPVPVMAR